MFAFLFQGVFATVIDPTEKKKRKKSKSDPEGTFIVTVCISEQGSTWIVSSRGFNRIRRVNDIIYPGLDVYVFCIGLYFLVLRNALCELVFFCVCRLNRSIVEFVAAIWILLPISKWRWLPHDYSHSVKLNDQSLKSRRRAIYALRFSFCVLSCQVIPRKASETRTIFPTPPLIFMARKD